MISSSELADLSSPSTQFLVIFIDTRRIEIITGKLSTDIKILLLLALAAIAERSVSEAAKPIELSNRVMPNKSRSSTGFERNSAKKTKPARERIAQSIKL